MLIALASERGTEQEKAAIDRLLGKPQITSAEISQLQSIIASTGAVTEVERMINSLTDQAIAALNSPELNSLGKSLLTDLAIIATQRSK